MDQHSGRSVVKADQAVPSVTASTLLFVQSWTYIYKQTVQKSPPPPFNESSPAYNK